MKKIFRQIIPLFIGGTIFLASCGKDDEVKVQQKQEAEFPTEFSTASVAQNKETLENNGIELVNNITQLKNTKAIQTTISLSTFLGSSSDESGMRTIKSSKAIQFMNLLGKFGQGKTTATRVLSNMRTTQDSVSIEQFYKENIGVHNYNKTTKKWDHTVSGDKIVMKFPSTASGLSNNASITIYEYKGVKTTNTLLNDYSGDFPTSLKVDLAVDNKVELSYSFSAKYNANGDPTSVIASLTLNPFKLAVEATNSTTEARVDYSFTKTDKLLFGFGSSAKGDFRSRDVEEVGSVITSGSAYFQIMNVKFSGESNVKALETALNSATTLDQEVAAINANHKLVVYFADSKKKIADSEFYGTTTNREMEDYNSPDCYFDEDTYEHICPTIIVKDESVNIRLIFADQSKSDLQNYVETGFEDIEAKFEAFVKDVEDDMN